MKLQGFSCCLKVVFTRELVELLVEGSQDAVEYTRDQLKKYPEAMFLK